MQNTNRQSEHMANLGLANTVNRPANPIKVNGWNVGANFFKPLARPVGANKK